MNPITRRSRGETEKKLPVANEAGKQGGQDRLEKSNEGLLQIASSLNRHSPASLPAIEELGNRARRGDNEAVNMLESVFYRAPQGSAAQDASVEELTTMVGRVSDPGVLRRIILDHPEYSEVALMRMGEVLDTGKYMAVRHSKDIVRLHKNEDIQLRMLNILLDRAEQLIQLGHASDFLEIAHNSRFSCSEPATNKLESMISQLEEPDVVLSLIFHSDSIPVMICGVKRLAELGEYDKIVAAIFDIYHEEVRRAIIDELEKHGAHEELDRIRKILTTKQSRDDGESWTRIEASIQREWDDLLSL
jgi:hypothetical protein